MIYYHGSPHLFSFPSTGEVFLAKDPRESLRYGKNLYEVLFEGKPLHETPTILVIKTSQVTHWSKPIRYDLFKTADLMDITFKTSDGYVEATVFILEVEDQEFEGQPVYRVYEHIGPAVGEIYTINHTNYKGPHKS